ncbi:DUF1254 domain-containing protein [Paraburkholderia sacchari]|uniref:DUF1254 domain-containing protein n=1 Tax=Paraburkholderia sacchari TaxID=159450 RepID=UPI001BCF58B0|nr:DUF1254 domain-containing protein [Paraburkholderia sacchari]
MNRYAIAIALSALMISGPAFSATENATEANHASVHSAQDLERQVKQWNATQAMLWAMPAVNFQLMLDAFRNMQGEPNQIAYWSKPLNWKNQTLTPNPATLYFMPFYDTRNGPMVLEIPPAQGGSITGSVDDAWQNPLSDVGPAGADKGKGGKYLILPPGYKGRVPAGYIALRSPTYQGFAILRSNMAEGGDKDIEQAVAYGKRVKFYPYGVGKGAGETHFVDAYDKLFDSTIPYDSRYFDALSRFVQVEPWLPRDMAMIDPLKSIGIEKDRDGTQLAANKEILNAAGAQAHSLLDLWTEKAYKPAFNEGSHWALPASPAVVQGMASDFAAPDSYPVYGRAVIFSMAYFSAKQLGSGQFYLMTIRDKDGNKLVGDEAYRLHVPANPPIKLYWSATAYDGSTHALIRESRWSNRGSNTPGLQKNADGSVDIYFGPSAPAGKEVNWIPTQPGKPFEVLFRFYGPEKPLFDKTWKLPDIEAMK